jgi:NADH-quinone oxidoreductase subunit J
MTVLFVIAANVAVAATLLAVVTRVTLHALLYLAVSLLAVAVVFYTLGAPFIAALEVIIYAGAIVVILMFAVMLLALDDDMRGGRRRTRSWLGPFALALVLLGEIVYIVTRGAPPEVGSPAITPTEVGATLFGPYAVAAELASMLLLVGLIGVRHLARERERTSGERGSEASVDAAAAPRAEVAADDAAAGEGAAGSPGGPADAAPDGRGAVA